MDWLHSTWEGFYEASAAIGGFTVFFLLLTLVLLMFLTAVAGSVIPILPGPVFAFFGVVLLKITIAYNTMSWWGVLACFVITLVSAVLDYVLPVKYTPTRAGAVGAFLGVFVGLFAGMFFPPIAILAIFLGPLLCAFAFEYSANSCFKKAWQSGKGAFWGTLMSVLARVAAIFLMVVVVLVDLAL